MPLNKSQPTWSQLSLIVCLSAALGACDSGGGGDDSTSTESSSSSSLASGSSSSDATSTSSTSSSGTSTSSSSSVPCNSPAAFCNDFESLETGPVTGLPDGWTISKSMNEAVSVTVSGEQHASGQKSLKVVSAGGGYNRGFLTLNLSKVAPLQQEMFGRMKIYVSDTNSNAGDFTFLQAEGSNPADASGAPAGTSVMFRGRIDQRYDHVFTNYDTYIDANADNISDWVTDCWKQPTFTETMPPTGQYILPKNQWACVQWHIARSSGHIDFTVDGLPLDQIRSFGNGQGCKNQATQDGNWLAPKAFEFLRLGVEQYSDQSLPRTVYIDDVAVDSQVVECDGTLSDPTSHQ